MAVWSRQIPCVDLNANGSKYKLVTKVVPKRAALFDATIRVSLPPIRVTTSLAPYAKKITTHSVTKTALAPAFELSLAAMPATSCVSYLR